MAITTTRSELCLRCAAVDFHSIFDVPNPQLPFPLLAHHTSETHLCTLEEAWNSASCPFCRLLVHLATQAFGILEVNDRQIMTCSLHQFFEQAVSPDGRYIPRLTIKIHHQCSNVLVRPSCPCRESRSRLLIAESLWDRLEITSVGCRSSRNPLLVRRPVASFFDPAMLTSWLTRSSTFSSDSSTGRSDRIALWSLMQTGRFRLFDVIANKIITKKHPVTYVALSYVWGDAMQEYIESCQEPAKDARTSHWAATEVDFAALPRTIQDAAILLRMINMQYLWVDALCIQQNSAVDKQAIISNMGAIYAGTHFTVVGACGDSAGCALSGITDQGARMEKPMSFNTVKGELSLLPAKEWPEKVIAETTWSTRGWTLQERLLSPRCLFFTESEVFFCTGDDTEREAFDVYCGRPNDDYYKETPWIRFPPYALLQNFTERSLTHQGDRLDAFLGLATRVQSSDLPMNHVAALSGLRLEKFAADLQWSHFDPESASRISMDARGSRILPSWSWVGWTGKILAQILTYTSEGTTKILDKANIEHFVGPTLSDFSPQRCQPTIPLQVIVHLWAPSLPCRLKKEPLSPISREYSIQVFDEDMNSHNLDTGVILPRGITLARQFELVVLKPRVTSTHEALLVRHEQKFAERVGLVKLSGLPHAALQCFQYNYIRLK